MGYRLKKFEAARHSKETAEYITTVYSPQSLKIIRKMPKSAIVISKSVVPPPRSPGNPEQIVVIAPKYDTACFLAAAMVRAIAHSRNCRATYYFVDYIDRRTWPNPNCIDSNTWLYMLGDFDMPAHVARAKDVGHFVSTETASVAAHFWTMDLALA